MMRMTITVDEKLVERARDALGVRTKSETIRLALEEVIRRKRLLKALTHQGTIDLDIDQKALELLRGTE